MPTVRNKIISFCLIAVLLIALPVTAFARELDYTQPGSIRVTLLEKTDGSPIVGAELSVYHVATVEQSAAGDLLYTYTEPFKDCGAEIDGTDLVGKLERFLGSHTVTAKKAVTDSSGTAAFSGLTLGLYFVRQTNTVDGFAPCKPFLVTVPMRSGGEYQYDVEATPKTEVEKLISITVKKVWNADATAAIPDSVTVQLLQGDTVVKTAKLHAQNKWQVTFTDMPKSDDYSVREINIPQGFTATYAQKGNCYTVTNTAALIQTGQLVWPVPVLAFAGLTLLLAGTVILRKERR